MQNHPELTDAQIGKLIGTTKATIAKVRDRSHWNTANIKPRNPVTLGLCSEADLEKAVDAGASPAGHTHRPARPMRRTTIPTSHRARRTSTMSTAADAAEADAPSILTTDDLRPEPVAVPAQFAAFSRALA